MCHLSVLLNKTSSRYRYSTYSNFSKSYRVRMRARTRKVSQKPLYVLYLYLHRIAMHLYLQRYKKTRAIPRKRQTFFRR